MTRESNHSPDRLPVTRRPAASKRADREAGRKIREARFAEARRIVGAGRCPLCGRPLRRNLSLAGWYQCEQFGAEGFRKDPAAPSCPFQTFTE